MLILLPLRFCGLALSIRLSWRDFGLALLGFLDLDIQAFRHLFRGLVEGRVGVSGCHCTSLLLRLRVLALEPTLQRLGQQLLGLGHAFDIRRSFCWRRVLLF